MVAEIDLALDAIPGGYIKHEIFRRYIVSQKARPSKLVVLP
jgi:hypothetical protein